MKNDAGDDASEAAEEMEDMAGNLKDMGKRMKSIISDVAGQSDVRFPELSDDYRFHANSLVANIQGMSDNMGYLNAEMNGATGAVCNDLEGPDALIPDSGYNWFSVCGEYSSRNANYRNPAIRYRTPYNMIGSVNTFLLSIGETEDPSLINMLAQVRVLRAYSYWCLVSDFQFNYQVAADKPSVPLVSELTEDFTNNPRATVKEIYDFMLEDLDWAVEHLAGAERSTKAYVDEHVARGLRARVYLEMGEWQKAYDDAVAAAEGYTPATIEEVSKPSFMDISEHNWIWGYDMTTDMALAYRYATTSSWLRSFSAWGYAAACQVYTCINTLLYNKIQAGDVKSKNAKPGQDIGVDEENDTIMSEINPWKFYHKRGAVGQASYKQFKFSTSQQFYIIIGKRVKTNTLGTQEATINKKYRQAVKDSITIPHSRDLNKWQKYGEKNKISKLNDQLNAQADAIMKTRKSFSYSPEQIKQYGEIGGAPNLDGLYTVFGEISEGMDVVEKINAMPTGKNGRPNPDVKIIRAYVLEEETAAPQQ